MVLSNVEIRKGKYCGYCATYCDLDKHNCCGCPLNTDYNVDRDIIKSCTGCCNGEWLKLALAFSWSEWVVFARDVVDYIKSHWDPKFNEAKKQTIRVCDTGVLNQIIDSD